MTLVVDVEVVVYGIVDIVFVRTVLVDDDVVVDVELVVDVDVLVEIVDVDIVDV